MSDRLQLRVVTPRRLVLDEAVREVTAPGIVGQFGVFPNHITFLSTLEVGYLEYVGERGKRVLAIHGGFAEVDDNVMTVLTEAAETPEEIDGAGAERDLREAAGRIEGLSLLDEHYPALAAERQWAQTRLDVAKKRS
jgi:F-type H+-transporting ATPase subunit epsilon